MRMMVDITITMPSSMESKLTKKAFQTKDIQIYGASWHNATYICPDCGFTYKRKLQ
jgi:hypothetical protein